MDFMLDKILFQSLGVNKTKVQDLVLLGKLLVFVLICTHVLACVWAYLGLHNHPDGSWVGDQYTGEDRYPLYVTSFYWITETITTVGYGDYSGKQNDELIFTMLLQFIGLIFFSLLMAAIKDTLFRNTRFDNLIEEKEENLELWVSQLEEANKKKTMTMHMYYEIKRYLKDAMLYDHNMIIEEYEFFDQLPPSLQLEVVDHVFGYLKGNK